MNLEATESMFFCGFDFVGLAGTSVPAWPRLRGTPKGIGGIATKSKTKGGWRHAPCLPPPKFSPKTQNQYKSKLNTKRKQNAKKSQTTPKKNQAQNLLNNCNNHNTSPYHRLSNDRLKTKKRNGTCHDEARDSD